ncbi:MAG: hypothetical protein IJX42_04905 [Oscillospiraceae bacterium]|nr:hypothetical protein [Oscillospiraceae bacterium]
MLKQVVELLKQAVKLSQPEPKALTKPHSDDIAKLRRWLTKKLVLQIITL